MKYYVVWFNVYNDIMRIDCHETDESRQVSVNQVTDKPWYPVLHNEVY